MRAEVERKKDESCIANEALIIVLQAAATEPNNSSSSSMAAPATPVGAP